jgi:hypothetical protein
MLRGSFHGQNRFVPPEMASSFGAAQCGSVHPQHARETNVKKIQAVLAALALTALGTFLALAQQPSAQAQTQQAPPQPMSFFITSAGSGHGANLGGLAAAAGSTKTWHAYLSTQGADAVNARDRIGAGPWYNAKGEKIANGLADLHGDTAELARLGNNVVKMSALNEKGEMINGRGDTPNRHDMLTGSQTDGRGYTDAADHTCGNWTSETTGTAQLGHFDRSGAGNTSWNSAHPSRGCSQENLVSTGGAGLFYCFAIN